MDGPDQPSPTILIVDDEPVVLSMLGEALRYYGFVVWTTDSGAEAVEVYRRGGIDLVLLDVRMPDPWDGPYTLAALRAVDPTVQAAFMSGSTGAYTVVELLALGARRVFAKPFGSFADLIADLRELVPCPPRVTLVDPFCPTTTRPLED